MTTIIDVTRLSALFIASPRIFIFKQRIEALMCCFFKDTYFYYLTGTLQFQFMGKTLEHRQSFDSCRKVWKQNEEKIWGISLCFYGSHAKKLC